MTFDPTPNLGLKKIDYGSAAWDADEHANADKIDAAATRIVYSALVRPAVPIPVLDGSSAHLNVASYIGTASEAKILPSTAAPSPELGKEGYIAVTAGVYHVHAAIQIYNNTPPFNRPAKLAIDAYCETTNVWNAEYSPVQSDGWATKDAILAFAADADAPSIDLIAFSITGSGTMVVGSYTLYIVRIGAGPTTTIVPA